MGTNHLGPFLLTMGMLPYLKHGALQTVSAALRCLLLLKPQQL